MFEVRLWIGGLLMIPKPDDVRLIGIDTRSGLVLARKTAEISLFSTLACALAELTSSTGSQRHEALFEKCCAPVLAITSISPWLVASTAFMFRRPHLRVLCVLEWTHCLSACVHHATDRDFLVRIGGATFLAWAVVLARKKAAEASIDSLHLSVTSAMLYLHLWAKLGHVFVLSGTGPMIALAPLVYLLLGCGDMQVADWMDFILLGALFVAENASNGGIEAETSNNVRSQVVHLAGHISIGYFVNGMNRRHFYAVKRT